MITRLAPFQNGPSKVWHVSSSKWDVFTFKIPLGNNEDDAALDAEQKNLLLLLPYCLYVCGFYGPINMLISPQLDWNSCLFLRLLGSERCAIIKTPNLRHEVVTSRNLTYPQISHTILIYFKLHICISKQYRSYSKSIQGKLLSAVTTKNLQIEYYYK